MIKELNKLKNNQSIKYNLKTNAMKKSFTRLFSIVMLVCMILLSAVAFGANPTLPAWYGVPTDGFSNYDGRANTLVVTLTFDQNVEPGTQKAGIIGLVFGGGQVDPIQIKGTTSTNLLTGSTAVINGNVVTVTFNRTLTQGQTYYVTVSSDALMNGAGEYFAGIANNLYDITIGDYTSPAVRVVSGVSQFTPRDENNNVTNSFPLGNNLSVQFTEPVAFGTGNIGIYTEDGNVVELFELATDIDGTNPGSPAAGKVGIVNDMLYINPTANLMELKKYYVRIAPTAIKDVSVNGNPFAGINNNTTWNFQAIDVTAPTATFVPATGANLIQQGQVMTITFSDNRTLAANGALSFEVRKDGVVNVAGTRFTIGEAIPATHITFTENGFAPVGAYTVRYTALNTITIAWGTG
ncbi:MAG: Ig-like domain-containing protein, partial [Draconibacterium sp.]|nr:Ig-like domain-containing protein [Draconibacterium sp.]